MKRRRVGRTGGIKTFTIPPSAVSRFIYVSSSANWIECHLCKNDRERGEVRGEDVTSTTFPASLTGCDASRYSFIRTEFKRGDIEVEDI